MPPIIPRSDDGDDLPPPPYTPHDPQAAQPTSVSEDAVDISPAASPVRTGLRGGYAIPSEAFEEVAPESAVAYFEERRCSFQTPSRELQYHAVVYSHSSPEDIAYPQPKDLYLARDITRRDWATFVNHMLPHHLGIRSSNGEGDKRRLEDGVEEQERQERIEESIAQWNEAFFGPRGVHVVPEFLQARTPDSSVDAESRGLPFTPLSLSVPASSAPSTPRPHMPPTPNIPSMPVYPNVPSPPGIPGYSAPQRPDIPSYSIPAQPEIPAYTLPSRPDIPSYNVPSRPEIPTYTIPRIPEIPPYTVPQRPEIPTYTIPRIPEIPPYTVPQRPEIPTYTIPQRPDIPSYTIPSRPEIPSFTVPLRPNIPIYTNTRHRSRREQHGHRHRRGSSSSSSTSESSVDSISSGDFKGAPLEGVRRSLTAFRLNPMRVHDVAGSVRQLKDDIRNQRDGVKRSWQEQTKQTKADIKATKKEIQAEVKAVVQEAKSMKKAENIERVRGKKGDRGDHFGRGMGGSRRGRGRSEGGRDFGDRVHHHGRTRRDHGGRGFDGGNDGASVDGKTEFGTIVKG